MAHAAEQIRERRLLHLFVVKEQVVFRNAFVEFDNLELHAVEADALVAVLSEDQRLGRARFRSPCRPSCRGPLPIRRRPSLNTLQC